MLRHDCKPACVAGWTGSRKCHCAACGENFSCPANFDAHRDRGECTNPAGRGMERNQRGVWVKPGEKDWDEQFGRPQTKPA